MSAPQVELTSTDLSDLDPTVAVDQHDQGDLIDVAPVNGSLNSAPSSETASEPKNSYLESAQNAMAAVQNHPSVQSAKNTVMNGEPPKQPDPSPRLTFAGPVAQQAKVESAKTRDEFADLASARTIPEHKTATGQNLTHYHSMFYRLLSWKNPRATGITFAAAILFIFASRYLNVIRYIFKAIYLTLGVTASAEVAGQLAFGRGLTSQFRPRQYFTIPKASLERLLDDLEQLINFFVIESQRIVFAENVYATGAAFFASLISYFLIKFVPLWGLSLIATVVTFLGPLVYIKNKEVIDAQLEKGYNLANQQATQLKGLANQHAGAAAKSVQGFTQQYTAKAQETISQYRGRSTSPEVKKEDFPAAPKHELPTEKPEIVVDSPVADEPELVPQTAL